MPTSPAYQPFLDRILEFATGERFADELARARQSYFRVTGEVFEEDRSFDVRMQAFLDWYLFDRPLAPFGEVPVRVWGLEPERTFEEGFAARVMSRTVHGLFVAESLGRDVVEVSNAITGARYEVRFEALDGVRVGDLFEGRLVPWQGALHFSPAFLFHPRHVRPRFEKAMRHLRKEGALPPVQDLVWLLARMASRAEHYPKMSVDTVYDFDRPPQIVDRPKLRLPPGRSRGQDESRTN